MYNYGFRAFAILGVLWLGAAQAGPSHVRIGNALIITGDTAKKVQEAGEPDHVYELTNAFGAKVGENWVYDFNNHTITIRINNAGYVVFTHDSIED